MDFKENRENAMSEKQELGKEHCANTRVEEGRQLSWATPAVDIFETLDELVLIADLPGVVENDLQIEVARGILTLEAPLAEKDSGRGFYRQFKVSERIDADSGSAALKDGVLRLRMPKIAEEKPKKIEVKTLH
jgi:HSP20 family molecular chaperone IbpA